MWCCRYWPLIFFYIGAIAAAPAYAADNISIETSGKVPGFTHEQLTSYLARKLQEISPAPWHFTAGAEGAAPAPDGISWIFKTRHMVWKGGSHKGFPAQSHSATYLSTEVKYYLGDAYQLTLITQPTLDPGSEDEILTQMVHRVSDALFVENQP